MIQHHDVRPMPEWMATFLRELDLPIHWLWIYVDIRKPNDCWPWTGSTRPPPENYGRFRYKGKARLSHRISYALCNGMSIEELEDLGYLVRHTCDNPLCCNPGHLVAGTHVDNMRDKRERCRFSGIRRGEQATKNKLKVREVLAIRAKLADGVSCTALAKEYGVTDSAIGMIGSGKNWAWLK